MNSPLRTLTIVTVLGMTPVDPQMAMYGMPQPPIHVGVPMPVPVPFAVIVSDKNSSEGCQKVRCRSKEDTPEPVPMAPPAAQPMGPPPYGVAYGNTMSRPMVLVIPFLSPTDKSDSDKNSDSSSEDLSSESDCEINTDSDDSLSSDSSFSGKTRKWIKKKMKKKNNKKKKKKRRKKHSKKHLRVDSRNDDELSDIEVRPVLSFVSRNGDVKISRRLSNAQAVRLLRRKRDNFDNRIIL